MPWCGLLWSDCTPVSLAEAEAVRCYVTGEKKALFFDDFSKIKIEIENKKSGKWQIYSGTKNYPSFVPDIRKLETNYIQVTDDDLWDNSWTDYILEGCVMLTEKQGNAGLIFRANDLGNNGADDFNGYYVGFDTRTLYLGKITKPVQDTDNKKQPAWKELQRFDLSKLECKVVPNVWNQIRIEVKGNQFRIWFNRMHESADKENGLRINYTDNNSPILKGKIGMRTFQCNANFDNIIVCSIEN